VWSDPDDVDTWAMSPRGAGWLFGARVTNEVIQPVMNICKCKMLSTIISAVMESKT